MAEKWVAAGERAFRSAEPSWGCWDHPEAELKLLPADMTGMDAIELGCGTAYVSSWMAQRGARVVGIDNSARQLESAQRLVGEHRLDWRSARVYPGGVEFNLSISEWLRLFRNTGFEVLDYLELQAPDAAPESYPTPGSWARSWPAEHVWKLHRLHDDGKHSAERGAPSRRSV